MKKIIFLLILGAILLQLPTLAKKPLLPKPKTALEVTKAYLKTAEGKEKASKKWDLKKGSPPITIYSAAMIYEFIKPILPAICPQFYTECSEDKDLKALSEITRGYLEKDPEMRNYLSQLMFYFYLEELKKGTKKEDKAGAKERQDNFLQLAEDYLLLYLKEKENERIEKILDDAIDLIIG